MIYERNVIRSLNKQEANQDSRERERGLDVCQKLIIGFQKAVVKQLHPWRLATTLCTVRDSELVIELKGTNLLLEVIFPYCNRVRMNPAKVVPALERRHT